MASIGVIVHSAKTLDGGPDALRAHLRDAGWADAPWREVARSKDAPRQVRRLLADGIDRLLVWGGDGTVRRCIDTVVAEGAPTEIAILPAGTANLLAHGLGIPIELGPAVDVALHGAVRTIDLGVMNGESFAVMAGSGFDALLIRDADETKQRIGRLAYLKAGVKHLASDPVTARVKVDGKPWFRGPVTCVLVGNLGRVMGGLAVFPDARCDDGKLDVGVVTAQSRSDWVRVGARAATGHLDASPLVEMTTGSKISVRLDRSMPWELDGGDRPKVDRLKVRVLPRRIPVCVPAP